MFIIEYSENRGKGLWCVLFYLFVCLLIDNSFIEIEFTYKVHLFKVYNSIAFSIFTELCDHHYNPSVGHFHCLKKKSCTISSHSPFPLPSFQTPLSPRQPLSTFNPYRLA